MRIRTCFLTTIVAFFVANGDVIAAEAPSAKAGSSTECSSAPVTAFARTLDSTLKQAKKTKKSSLEIASKDPSLRKLAAKATSTVSIVEDYLRCRPSANAGQVEVAIMTLECLRLDTYLGFLQRLSHAAKSEAGELVLYYAVAPLFPWSSRLASNHTDARVVATLGEIDRSPNANPAVRRIVLEIRDGSAGKLLAENPIKPVFRCGAD